MPEPNDNPEVIDVDLRCVGCAYSLRGLPRSGTCPECGTTIDLTRRELLSTAARLAHVPPRVAKRLRLAMLLLILGNLMWCALFSTALLASSVPLLRAFDDVSLATRGGNTLALLVSTIGWWLLLNGESEGTGPFVPILSPENASLLLRMRVLTTLVTLILVWPQPFDPSKLALLLLLLLGLGVIVAHLALVPLQYNVVMERWRRLRRAKGHAHGCVIAIGMVIFFALVVAYEPHIVSIMFVVTPIVLAGLLLAVHLKLRHAARSATGQVPR